MTLPTITEDCVRATLEKSTQSDPQLFAEQVMVDLLEDQPMLMAGINSILRPFCKVTDLTEEVGLDSELMLMATFCVLGVTLKAIDAQTFAEEMKEVEND